MKKKPPISLKISNTIYDIAIELHDGSERIRVRKPAHSQYLDRVEKRLIRRYLIAEGFVRSKEVRFK